MRASEMENKIYKQRFLSTKKKVYDKKEKEKSNFLGLIHMDGSAVVLLSLYNSYGLSLSERMRKREREREW